MRAFQAAGGIEITASHNPSPYNGLKLFSAEGRVIPAGPGEKVLERIARQVTRLCGLQAATAWDGLQDRPRASVGPARGRCDDTLSPHLLAVLATVDAERIRQRQFRVVLDSNHGAGSILGRRLLEELGCRVTVLGEEPDGQFAHPPEPTAENLAGVLAAVTDAGADSASAKTPTPTGWP